MNSLKELYTQVLEEAKAINDLGYGRIRFTRRIDYIPKYRQKKELAELRKERLKG